MAAWLIAVTLLAQGVEVENRDVRQGVQMYEAVDFRAARRHLERALDRGELNAEDRKIALAYLGRAFAALEQRRRAERVFRELLALSPEFQVSEDESPRIRAAFAAARELSGIPAAQPATNSPTPPDEQPTVTTPPAAGAEDPARGPTARQSSEQAAVEQVAAIDPLVGEPGLMATEPAESGTPWGWVGLGVGVLAVGTAAALLLLWRESDPEVDTTWVLD